MVFRTTRDFGVTEHLRSNRRVVFKFLIACENNPMIYGVCESYIPGTFYGLQTDEDYTLADGTVWRVISPIYRERKAKNPRATVFRNGRRHFLKVKGMPHEVEVEPIWLNPVTLEIPSDWGVRENSSLAAQLEIRKTTTEALEKWQACWSWLMESGERPRRKVPDFDEFFDDGLNDDFDEDTNESFKQESDFGPVDWSSSSTHVCCDVTNELAARNADCSNEAAAHRSRK